MIFRNRKIKNIISFFLIAAILAPSFIIFSVPKKAEAQIFGTGAVSTVISDISTGISATLNGVNNAINGTQLGIKIKEVATESAKEVQKAVDRRLLAEMTKSTVNWINTGFHGRPLFVENPDSFFRDIAKSEIKDLVNTYGYDTSRFPYGRQFALNIISSYKRKSADNAAYTLSNAIQDPVTLKRYQTDFNFGGWDGFLVNTQYPQNNYVGFQMVAADELAQRLEGTATNTANKVRDTLQQGQGFLSPQTCPSNLNYNNGLNAWDKPQFDQAKYDKEHLFSPPSRNLKPGSTTAEINASIAADLNYANKYNADLIAAKAAWADPQGENVCPGKLVNTTPGSVVSGQILSALKIPQDQASLGAALGGSLSAVFDALLNHFLSEGLDSLASKVKLHPTVDTFSYEDKTLGSPGTNVNGE